MYFSQKNIFMQFAMKQVNCMNQPTLGRLIHHNYSSVDLYTIQLESGTLNHVSEKNLQFSILHNFPATLFPLTCEHSTLLHFSLTIITEIISKKSIFCIKHITASYF